MKLTESVHAFQSEIMDKMVLWLSEAPASIVAVIIPVFVFYKQESKLVNKLSTWCSEIHDKA